MTQFRTTNFPRLKELLEASPEDFLVIRKSSEGKDYKIRKSNLTGSGQQVSLAWDSEEVYDTPATSIGSGNPAYAEFNNKLWKSKIDNNQGNQPAEDANWTEVSKNESGLVPHAAGVYTQEEVYVTGVPKAGYPKCLLRLTVATRPYETTDLVAEYAAGDWEIIGFIQATQSEVDLAINDISFVTPLTLDKKSAPTFTPTNQLTFNSNKIGLQQNGGTWNFTLAASGNINGKTIFLILNTPDAVTFSSDFVSLDSTVPDVSKKVHFFGYYNQQLNKVFYSIKNTAASDLTAPTIQSATVEDSADTSLVVVFNEPVTITDLTGLSLDFTTGTAKTLQSVSGSGTNTLTFTLDASVVEADVFTLEVAASNNIVDSSSNGLEATSQAVTNNVSDAFDVSSISPDFIHLPMDVQGTNSDPATVSTDKLTSTSYDFNGSNSGVPRSIQNSKECLDFGVENLSSQSTALSSLFQNTFSISVQIKLNDGQPSAVGYVCYIANTTVSRFWIDIRTDGKITVAYGCDSTTVFAQTANSVFADVAMSDFVQLAVRVNSGSNIEILIDEVVQTLSGSLDGDISGLTMANFNSSNAKLVIGAQTSTGTSPLDCYMRHFTLQPVAYTAQNLTDLATL
ncbi:hypothetical protein C900_05354 [Fulvivirga imtechensis AK7]|uniref:Uncharacterized protein n=1 Tax=Fulvivirga imtechensis AK7 TaxID=1237149 RepID=L8JLN9_9BACT|nr:Ig-like domain-containing protein [Fulvivirga imtechensis]ELR69158.1 hypothetical protein C900_05354 [Fulvivirga imtechensis AK7]